MTSSLEPDAWKISAMPPGFRASDVSLPALNAFTALDLLASTAPSHRKPANPDREPRNVRQRLHEDIASRCNTLHAFKVLPHVARHWYTIATLTKSQQNERQTTWDDTMANGRHNIIATHGNKTKVKPHRGPQQCPGGVKHAISDLNAGNFVENSPFVRSRDRDERATHLVARKGCSEWQLRQGCGSKSRINLLWSTRGARRPRESRREGTWRTGSAYLGRGPAATQS